MFSTRTFYLFIFVLCFDLTLSGCGISLSEMGTLISSVSNSQPAPHLVFSTQPSISATVGATLSSQPVVQVQSSSNAVLTTYSAPITLSAYSDSACTTLVSSGTLSGTASTVNGTASFSGVNFSQAGTIYLKATSGSLTSACSARAVILPVVPSGQYYVGGMDGEVCVPKSGVNAYDTPPSGTLTWLPTEDFCVVSGGGGVGNFSITPSVQNEGVPAINGDGDTQEIRIQKASGTSYSVTITNNDGGGFGGPITFTMNTYTALQLASLQAAAAAPNHSMLYGSFARGGSVPYGIYSSFSSPYPIDATKAANILNAGVQITRLPMESFWDDLTGIVPSEGYNFAADDPAITWLLANNIIPFIDLEAGPKQYGPVGGPTTEPLYHNPTEFGAWCSAVANHLHATFPALGISVPMYFGTPFNEPNGGGWDASQSDNPTLYAETASGPALYMKACYSALKAVFPTSVVYGGELAMAPTGSGEDVVTEVTRWYTGAASCRIGTCFDAFSLHISPIGDPLQPVTHCYEPSDGWTFQCIADLQAVTASFGDTIVPHAMITETEQESVPNSNNSAGDEPGQSWWVAQDLAAAGLNASIDGIFYANIDEDSMYGGTTFADGGLIDTSGGWTNQRKRASYYTYCSFAEFPLLCPP